MREDKNSTIDFSLYSLYPKYCIQAKILTEVSNYLSFDTTKHSKVKITLYNVYSISNGSGDFDGTCSYIDEDVSCSSWEAGS